METFEHCFLTMMPALAELAAFSDLKALYEIEKCLEKFIKNGDMSDLRYGIEDVLDNFTTVDRKTADYLMYKILERGAEGELDPFFAQLVSRSDRRKDLVALVKDQMKRRNKKFYKDAWLWLLASDVDYGEKAFFKVVRNDMKNINISAGLEIMNALEFSDQEDAAKVFKTLLKKSFRVKRYGSAVKKFAQFKSFRRFLKRGNKMWLDEDRIFVLEVLRSYND